MNREQYHSRRMCRPWERDVVRWLMEHPRWIITLGVHPEDKEPPTRWIIICMDPSRPASRKGAKRIMDRSVELGVGTCNPYPCKGAAHNAVIRICLAAGRTADAREARHRLLQDVQRFGYTAMWEEAGS